MLQNLLSTKKRKLLNQLATLNLFRIQFRKSNPKIQIDSNKYCFEILYKESESLKNLKINDFHSPVSNCSKKPIPATT